MSYKIFIYSFFFYLFLSCSNDKRHNKDINDVDNRTISQKDSLESKNNHPKNLKDLFILTFVPKYGTNDYFRLGIEVDDYYYKYLICIEKINLNNDKYINFFVSNTIINKIKSISSYNISSKYIKIENPTIIYGTSYLYETIHSIYSPTILGKNYINEDLQFGLCTDFNYLDSTKIQYFKNRYEKEVLDSLIKECQ
jgi:hypothetical protein